NLTRTISIADDETATVAFKLAESTAGEDAGFHSVVVVLSTSPGATLASKATFNVSAANGTASDNDYDSGVFTSTITFAAGNASGAVQTVDIRPLPDLLVEGDETVTLSLTALSGAAGVGAQATHT